MEPKESATKTSTFIHYLKSNSAYFKLGFFGKLTLFLIFSTIALYDLNPILNTCIAVVLFGLIIQTGFVKRSRAPFKALVLSNTALALFWVLDSRVSGNFVYFTLPWGTYFSDATLRQVLITNSRWTVAVLSGLLFLITTSEDELVGALISLRIPDRIKLAITVAFNTMGYSLRDVETINRALHLRGYKETNFVKRLRKMYYLGTVFILSNLKRVSDLNQSYAIVSQKEETVNPPFSSLHLSVSRLSYETRTKPIAVDMKVSLSKGDILAVLGRTGSGKTTILKTVAGIVPDLQYASLTGEVLLDGARAEGPQLRRSASLALQEAENQLLLNNGFTEMKLRLRTDHERDLARTLLQKFEATSLFAKAFKDLSTGQRKLMSLIYSLSESKTILLLDEPTANLDDASKRRLLDYLDSIRKDKIILIATHDKSVIPICNKYLASGEDVGTWDFDDAPPKLLVERPALAAWVANSDPGLDMKGRNMIRLDDVGFSYPDGSKALNHITLSVREGEVVGLIGGNGSGKSTLARLLAGILKPTQGSITYESTNLRMGYVQQEPEKQLFCPSVLDELLFGLDDSTVTKDVNDLCLDSKLAELVDEHPFFISRGQQQVLLISSMLLRESNLVLIDEPFTGMDNRTIQEILMIMMRIFRENGSALILTDQTDEIMRGFATKLVYLEEGSVDRIVQKDLARPPEVVSQLLG